MFVWPPKYVSTPPHSCIESDAAIMSTTTNPHQVFTCRDAWHFAVARDYPFARSTFSVLTESRVADGTVIAQWEHGKGTGWRRSLVTPISPPATAGKAMNLAESFRSSLLDLTVATLAPAVAARAGGGGDEGQRHRGMRVQVAEGRE